MDYECLHCGYCVGRENYLREHYRTHPECDAVLWATVGGPVVERAKREILADIAAGVVPPTVANFSELHDFVDANTYAGACDEDPEGSPQWFDGDDAELELHASFWNRVQNEVHEWLTKGGHRTNATN